MNIHIRPSNNVVITKGIKGTGEIAPATLVFQRTWDQLPVCLPACLYACVHLCICSYEFCPLLASMWYSDVHAGKNTHKVISPSK